MPIQPAAQTPLQLLESNPNILNNAGNRPVNFPTAPPAQASTTTASNLSKIQATPSIIQKSQNLTNVGVRNDVGGIPTHANGDMWTPPPPVGGYMDYSQDPQGIYVPYNQTKNSQSDGTYRDYAGNSRAIPQDGSIPEGVQIVGTTGNGSYIGSDGRQYAPPTGDTSYIDKEIQNNNLAIKSASDAAMADAINTIQRNYENYINQQSQINSGQQAGVRNALLMGGVTGQGSQGQYASASADSNLTSTINYGQQQIIKLQNDRDALISAAKNADYSTAAGVKQLSSLNEQLEKNRTEQLDKAKDLSALISAQTQKKADEKVQSDTDNAIADIYSQGITDVPTILKTLRGKGWNITSAQIVGGLKNMVPPGLDDLIKTLRANAAPNDVIQKVLASKDISEAYTNASNYASGGTGIIGEYNYALSHGYTGSFSDYQNEDANRKKSIAAAGVAGASGYSPTTVTKIQQITGQFDSEPSIKNYQVIKEAESFVKSLGTGTSANAGDDQGLLYAFAKAMDPNSVVREGEYATVQKYAQSWADTFKFNAKRILSNSPFLTDKAREQMKATITKKANASTQSFNNIYSEYGRRINKISGGNDGTDFITDYSGGYGPSDIIKSDTDAINAISQFHDQSPENAQRINQLKTIAPNASAMEIAQKLGLIK